MAASTISLLSDSTSEMTLGDGNTYFFKLPLELREQIYTLTLPYSTSTRIICHLVTPPRPLHIWSSGSLALLLVNKQIHSEVFRLFWRSNIFDATFEEGRLVFELLYEYTPDSHREVSENDPETDLFTPSPHAIRRVNSLGSLRLRPIFTRSNSFYDQLWSNVTTISPPVKPIQRVNASLLDPSFSKHLRRISLFIPNHWGWRHDTSLTNWMIRNYHELDALPGESYDVAEQRLKLSHRRNVSRAVRSLIGADARDGNRREIKILYLEISFFGFKSEGEPLIVPDAVLVKEVADLLPGCEVRRARFRADEFVDVATFEKKSGPGVPL